MPEEPAVRLTVAVLAAVRASPSRGDSPWEEIAELRAEITQLQGALLTRAVIDQAKGLLMGVHGCDSEDAFAVLSRVSQHHNVKLRVVAAALVGLAPSPDHAPVTIDPATAAAARDALGVRAKIPRELPGS